MEAVSADLIYQVRQPFLLFLTTKVWNGKW